MNKTRKIWTTTTHTCTTYKLQTNGWQLTELTPLPDKNFGKSFRMCNMRNTYLEKAVTVLGRVISGYLAKGLKILHPTRHKIGHFGDIGPSQSLGLVLNNRNKYNKVKHVSKTKYTTTYNKPKKLKPGLVASYDLWPGNGTSLFWKE